MKKVDPSIFKAYDIRGIYPEQIDAEVVYGIAQAFVKFLTTPADAKAMAGEPSAAQPPLLNEAGSGLQLQFSPPKIGGVPSAGGGGGMTIAVGHDMRLSGEEFSLAAIRGLVDAGVDVIDIGLCSTEQLYFAAATLSVQGGIQITASHNPKEYGGLKLVRQQGKPISGDTGIYQIRDLVVSYQWTVDSEQKGTVEKKDITEDYFKHLLSKFDISKIKPLKIVANANFGMAGVSLKKLQTLLPVEFVKIINGELDGTFPKGRPDPLVPENRGEIIETIKQLKPDLGVAWDADADRCFFFDELGNFVTPAYASALFTQYYLQKNPGAKILHDTRVVRVIDYATEQNGGVSIMTKAGHSYIKDRMMQEQAVFGCETSAHYYFKDNFYLDNGLFPFLAMLEILSAVGPSSPSEERMPSGQVRLNHKTFSQILKPLRDKFYISEEINFKLAPSSSAGFENQNILEDIKSKYSDAKLGEIDGYDFNYPDWRFNIRRSNTESLLRVNIEANSQQLLDEKTKELSDLINSIK